MTVNVFIRIFVHVASLFWQYLFICLERNMPHIPYPDIPFITPVDRLLLQRCGVINISQYIQLLSHLRRTLVD